MGVQRQVLEGLKPESRRLLLDSIADTIPIMTIGYLKDSADAIKEAPSKGVTVYPESDRHEKSIAAFATNVARAQAIEQGTSKFKLRTEDWSSASRPRSPSGTDCSRASTETTPGARQA